MLKKTIKALNSEHCNCLLNSKPKKNIEPILKINNASFFSKKGENKFCLSETMKNRANNTLQKNKPLDKKLIEKNCRLLLTPQSEYTTAEHSGITTERSNKPNSNANIFLKPFEEEKYSISRDCFRGKLGRLKEKFAFVLNEFKRREKILLNMNRQLKQENEKLKMQVAKLN